MADPFYLTVHIPSWLQFIAITFLTTGIVVILLGVLHLNKAMDHTMPSLKNTGLFFKGIYRYVRHPIYAGMLIVLMAVAWYTGSWFKASITVVLGVIFYFKSSLEEQKLIAEYLQYQIYKDNTGRFFPKLKNIRSR